MRGMKSVVLPAVGLFCAMMFGGCAGKPPANGPGALNIAAFTLAQGAMGVPYKQLLIASGGVQPYTWSVTSGGCMGSNNQTLPGMLPPGLSLSSDGVISGTPTTVETCNFAVQVSDSQLPVHAVANQGLSITINQDLSFTSMQLGNGTVGMAYNQTISAANGVPPYTYIIDPCQTCGNLPGGLSLMTTPPMNNMANSATITGMPTTAGVYTFTVQATDSAAETATAVFTITVVGRIQGQYALTFNGFTNNGQPFYLIGSMCADGNGNINPTNYSACPGNVNPCGGSTNVYTLDQSGPSPDETSSCVPFTGTYSIPTGSNFGTISLNSSLGDYQFTVALSGDSTDSKLIMTNTDVWGSGLLKKQTGTTVSGGVGYAFGSFGVDPGGNRFAGAGAFALGPAPSLSVTGGAEDSNDNGTLSGEQCITGGSFSTPDLNTGRGTATLMVAPLANGTCGTPTSTSYTYYVASNTELVAIETDSGGPMTLVDLLQQQTVGASGGLILCKQGQPCQSVLALDGIATSGTPEAEVGVASANSCSGTPCVGNFMRSDSLPPYYVDQSVGGTFNSVTYSGGTYSIDATCGIFTNPCGRVTLNLQGPSNQPVWYLVTTGQAFVVGGDADVLQGTLQPQAPPTGGFTLPNFLGSYLGGTITPALPIITNELDVAGTPPPGGIWSQTYQTSGQSGPETGLSFMGPYNIDLVNLAGQCNPTTGANCLGAALGRFAICAPNTTQFCSGGSMFMFDPSNPPVSIVYVAGGAQEGATGGKAGLVGLNFGIVNQQTGTATLDPNPRLSTLGR